MKGTSQKKGASEKEWALEYQGSWGDQGIALVLLVAIGGSGRAEIWPEDPRNSRYLESVSG